MSEYDFLNSFVSMNNTAVCNINACSIEIMEKAKELCSNVAYTKVAWFIAIAIFLEVIESIFYSKLRDEIIQEKVIFSITKYFTFSYKDLFVLMSTAKVLLLILAFIFSVFKLSVFQIKTE